jgi:uncharacterized protein YuzE
VATPATAIEMAHTTEFPLVDGPISRPVDIIRLLVKGGLPLKMARFVVERLAVADIKGRYYHETDRLYIEIAPGPSAETREVASGLNIDLDAQGNVIGFDVDNSLRLGALLRDFVASSATVEDLARAWASRDVNPEELGEEKGLLPLEVAHSHYLGHLAEAEEILRRAVKYARERNPISSDSEASP